MRTLISMLTVSLTTVAACSKDREDAAPCAQAVENTRRLVERDPEARAQYGADPLTLERCRSAKHTRGEVSCMGYASTWDELTACSPVALDVENAGGITADRDDRVRVDD